MIETSSRKLRGRRRPWERIVLAILAICGAISIATTIGILYELGKESLLFFQDPQVSVVDFFTTTIWQPQAGSFGIWPLILGTMIITVIAILGFPSARKTLFDIMAHARKGMDGNRTEKYS